jgi:predicted AlkP superfamily pyrophosphatase or phosphodiesterase
VKSTTAIVSALLMLGAAPALAQTAPARDAAPPAAPVRAPLPSTNVAPGRPTLIVTIVVDQFSANLFNQYRSRFTGGLKTLADQGLVYTNGFQSHGVTTTCPGHSTVLTGAHPTHTGIPTNEWIDPATGQQTYCLAAPANTIAGGAHGENGLVGPDRLLVTNLPDWVKAQSPNSRVFAVSGKDRGAINLAGHHPDGAFWIEGPMLTTYVEPGQTSDARLAPIAAFNAAYKAQLAASPNPAWTFQHDLCRTLRGTSTIGGETFHADLPPEDANLEDSPWLDETTLDAATYLLESQQMGRRGVVDLLGVSLSGTDKIGHAYGTQGPEMCEQLLRMDEALGAFLGKVAAVPGGAIVVLTADHGGSDFPERMTDRGAAAGRYDPDMLKRVNARLKTQFNLTDSPLQSGGTGFIVADKDKKALAEPLRSQIIAAAIPLLNAEPNIALAVPRDELLNDPMPPRDFNPEELTVRERLRLSAVAGRGADILRGYAYNLTVGGRIGGAISSHGSPWDYDRRVPIIFWRPGERGEEHFWPLRTVDIAPTLANLIGVPTPDTVDGQCQNLGLFDVPVCPVAAAEPAPAH